MTFSDVARLAWEALRRHRVRTRLTYAAVAIGIASVLVLTALGQGARGWIVDRFASLGSSVLYVMPGRTETRGGPPLAPATTRDLTLEDALAVERRLPGVEYVVPLVVGEALVTHDGRGRSTTVIGSTDGFLRMRGVPVETGSDLPDVDVRQGMRVCLIGRTLRRELFGTANPLGARLQIGEEQFRVQGVIAQHGQAMFVNMDEIVLVPVANAMQLFNRTGLFRILVQLRSLSDLDAAKEHLNALLRERHDGEEDFTILTPGALAASLGAIVNIVTAALVGIAAISLAVAGIGVMNVMVVAVAERAGEIGLMKAIGASPRQILSLFLAEAAALSMIGGALGILAGLAAAKLGRTLFPDVPFHVPASVVALAFGVAATVGIAFGIAPARRAARLEPLESMRRSL